MRTSTERNIQCFHLYLTLKFWARPECPKDVVVKSYQIFAEHELRPGISK